MFLSHLVLTLGLFSALRRCVGTRGMRNAGYMPEGRQLTEFEFIKHRYRALAIASARTVARACADDRATVTR